MLAQTGHKRLSIETCTMASSLDTPHLKGLTLNESHKELSTHNCVDAHDCELSNHNHVTSQTSRGLNHVNSVEGEQSSQSLNRVNSVDKQSVSRTNSVEGHGLNRVNSVEGHGLNRVNSVEGHGLNRVNSVEGHGLNRVNSVEGRRLSRGNSVEGAYLDCDCDACLLGFDDTQSDGETKPENQAKLKKAVNVLSYFHPLVIIV